MRQQYKISLTGREIKPKMVALSISIWVNGDSQKYKLVDKIPLKNWDFDRKCLKGEATKDIEEKFHKYRRDIIRYIEDANERDIKVTPSDVIATFSPNNSSSAVLLIKTLEAKWKDYYNNGNANTAASYLSTINSYKEFLKYMGKGDIGVGELNEQFFEDFASFYNHQNASTVNKKIDHVFFVIQKGLDMGYFRRDPSENVKKKLSRQVAKASSEKIKLKNIDIDNFTKIKELPDSITKDVLLFSCYTGLAFIDIQKLKFNDIKIVKFEEKEITYVTKKRTKTGTDFSLIIPKEGKEILEKYHSTDHRIYLDMALPVPSYMVYRKNLFEIGEQIGLYLTSHMARYCFINLARDKGYSDEYIRNAVGHNSNNMIDRVYAGELKIKRQAMEYFKL